MGNTDRWLMVAVLVAGVWACAEQGAPERDTDRPEDPRGDGGDTDRSPVPCAPYEAFGPWPVGVRTISLPDREVEVWYPAVPGSEEGRERATYDLREWLPPEEAAKIPDGAPSFFVMPAWRDLPAAPGPLPLALYSHGIAAFRSQSSWLTAHLASWGFVVAAPEHVERNLTAFLDGTFAFDDVGSRDLRAARDLLLVESERAGGPLEGRVDGTRVVALGHSMGAGAALLLAEQEGLAGVACWAGGPSPQLGVSPTRPLLMAAGTVDTLVPSAAQRTIWEGLTLAPRVFVSLDRAGHLAFTDLCAIGRDLGGLVAMAVSYGVAVPEFLEVLGSDGCQEGALDPWDGWPVVGHYTVAHLRLALGLDPEPTGLDDITAACFGSRLEGWAFVARQVPVSPSRRPVSLGRPVRSHVEEPRGWPDRAVPSRISGGIGPGGRRDEALVVGSRDRDRDGRAGLGPVSKTLVLRGAEEGTPRGAL